MVFIGIPVFDDIENFGSYALKSTMGIELANSGLETVLVLC